MNTRSRKSIKISKEANIFNIYMSRMEGERFDSTQLKNSLVFFSGERGANRIFGGKTLPPDFLRVLCEYTYQIILF
jgi:hypothetical protein